MSKALPDKIGSLLFCSACGNLLDQASDEDVIKCAACATAQDASVYDNLTIVTRSHPTAFPSALRQKRQLVSTLGDPSEAAEREKAATINEKCPKCGHDELQFHTLQLRSADEGSTVFYDCPKCGHSFSQNN
ncbi:putative RPA12-13.7 kd subunit of DNA-directed RNA polymerase I [Tilletiaria anomala UBC 951]|uniref:DNA-directed RNA polymerase subunit n=1 Tax=Tilletiaria anomala (strain ATCC 24038 / CBS 436.72 / UBC 951) TaxID=1037660 RepID=A0A066VW78_TILAU|nr:putative RPA12-13.7 kd subunit of DNA-directed RNA polymerase I [Tilletiaria anomala UBC 951]KDN44543.1 putative RPA12-13.7 kd subunit of DNA-directed RNA polymerase I [Tilletiaria anomala UBC 951]